MLSDIVRVIRKFRPDVVITRFSPEPGNTHGHHTASAVLALEAFKLAGDPKAFPGAARDPAAVAAEAHSLEQTSGAAPGRPRTPAACTSTSTAPTR